MCVALLGVGGAARLWWSSVFGILVVVLVRAPCMAAVPAARDAISRRCPRRRRGLRKVPLLLLARRVGRAALLPVARRWRDLVPDLDCVDEG